MVGFGSAYRMSRRRGWEGAYFDYDTLKLLLTQIEAVYEENTGLSSDGHYSFSGLSGFGSEDIFDARYDRFDERLKSTGSSARRKARQRQKHKSAKEGHKLVDWRDELFAESDSSAAFASSECDSEEGRGGGFVDQDDNLSLEDARFNFSYGNSGVPSYGSSGSFIIGGATSAASGTLSNESGTSLDNQKSETEAVGENRPILPYGQSAKGHNNVRKSASQKRKKILHKRKANVPPHLRKSHEKARAITGRFLGLLRAEVDKVSLFVHSRMGELTDTIGSLRFPSDTMDFENEYRHHLSDGGIHPSSSSSSDDSSAPSAGTSNDLDAVKTESNLFPKRRRSKRNGNIMEPDFMHQKYDAYCDKYSAKSTTMRQLSLAEHIRLTRPIFRSDQVLGEDFLLLSAVDEADAFAAVGVEYLHLLRFICINAIAIRKLCKKHDRLLSNRMLGGYYHKLQKKSENEDVDIMQSSTSGINSTPRRRNTKRAKRVARDYTGEQSYNLLPGRRFGSNILLGTYDSEVQALANSLVANTLSKNLGLALTEFEISRRRADRLSSIPIKNSNTLSLEKRDDEVEPDDLCYGFPSPKKFRLAPKKTRDEFKEELKLDDEKCDAHSSSSSISLSRLRFIVNSVETLRQAAVENKNVFSEYLARSSLVFDGCRFVGEPKGLNGGCSRETLDFFASYNPDLILVVDPHILHQYMKNHLQYNPDIPVPMDPTTVYGYSQSSDLPTKNIVVPTTGIPLQTLVKPTELVSLKKIRRLNLCFTFLSTVSTMYKTQLLYKRVPNV